MDIDVETSVNAVGDPEPVRFRVGPRRLAVRAVLDRWLDPERGYFKVEADDGAVYILRRDSGNGGWDIALYDSNRRPPQPPSGRAKRLQ